MQNISNTDFDVAIKIDSPLVGTDATTSQGLMVFDDNQDYITFALTTDGTSVGLKAATVLAGAATTVLNDRQLAQYQNPMYLRMSRTGSAYVAYYSIDGLNWTQATSFTYTRVPVSIGPFASNYNDTSANAVPVVMAVNWFDVQQ
jgi:spore coat polysaccharide biosynthesis protein SpsF (cytidylyltransferase family)